MIASRRKSSQEISVHQRSSAVSSLLVALATCCITLLPGGCSPSPPTQQVGLSPQTPPESELVETAENQTDKSKTDSAVPDEAQATDPAAEPTRVVLSSAPTVDRFGRLELTFDDLAFDMEKTEDFDRSMLTEKIESFDGAEIRLRGFIRPSFRQNGISKFVFVRDNKECCFGPGAALFDCVLVQLAKGAKTEYTVRPIVVAGKFSLKEYQGPDGRIWSIYQLKNGKVE